jgi:HlyD family secretion protein
LVSVRNPFRPGMSAAVYVQTETHRNILAVPIQCVTTRPDLKPVVADTAAQKDSVTITPPVAPADYVERVFVVQPDATVKAVEVKTGIQDNTHIEITQGLTDSLKVVTGPYNMISRRLNNGTKIKINSEK